MKAIARIENHYDGKFGVPRQSGLVENVLSRVVFEPEYRAAEAVRGLEEFSHIWLIWGFDRAERGSWRPTVRPPRLGGNQRVGVFATRSPFRPNPIGLSCVRLLRVELTDQGPVLTVAGADLANGSPIYDIKPYLPYTDCHPEASGGFTERVESRKLMVTLPEGSRNVFSEAEIRELIAVLEQDPRPRYQDDPERVYAFEFAGKRVSFRVEGNQAIVLDQA